MGVGGVVRNAWIDLDVTLGVKPTVIVDVTRRLSSPGGQPLAAGGRHYGRFGADSGAKADLVVDFANVCPVR